MFAYLMWVVRVLDCVLGWKCTRKHIVIFIFILQWFVHFRPMIRYRQARPVAAALQAWLLAQL